MNIVLYTRINPPCSYCEGAKLYLQDRNIPYEEIIIGKQVTREEFVKAHPDKRTLPAVFIDGEFIGGYTEMKSFIEAKEVLSGVKL